MAHENHYRHVREVHPHSCFSPHGIGMLSAGWYSILTGAVLLHLAHVLGSVSWSDDKAAVFVAAAFAVTGVWQLERGLRAEFQRRPKPTGEPPQELDECPFDR